MKIISFKAGGAQRFGVVTGGAPEDGHAVDATSMDPALPTVLDVLKAGALGRLAEWADGRSPDVSLAEVELLPPVIGSAKVLCAGVNYANHRDEANAKQAEHPVIFTRFADTHLAHGRPLIIPAVAEHLDFEGELAAVIGRDVYREDIAAASDAVAAWACYNDGSVRDWQFHASQWIPGKNFPATGGFGPWIVTAEEVGDESTLELSTRVNGETVQHASLKDLIFDVPALVSYISQFTPLHAGDLLVTGTPGGVGAFREPPLWLKPGDVVEVEIPRVGLLRNPVAAEA